MGYERSGDVRKCRWMIWPGAYQGVPDRRQRSVRLKLKRAGIGACKASDITWPSLGTGRTEFDSSASWPNDDATSAASHRLKRW